METIVTHINNGKFVGINTLNHHDIVTLITMSYTPKTKVQVCAECRRRGIKQLIKNILGLFSHPHTCRLSNR